MRAAPGVIVLLFLVAMTFGCQQSPQPSAVGVTNPAPALIGTTYLALYSDQELDSLQQFHSSPGTDVKLTSNVHLGLFADQQRTVLVDEGYESPTGEIFMRVRVLDGPERGKEGWVMLRQLRDISTITPLPRG